MTRSALPVPRAAVPTERRIRFATRVPLPAAARGAVLLVCAGIIQAQEPTPPAVGAPVTCAGQTVSEIQVQTKPPYYPRNGKWWQTPLGIVSSLHVNTRPDVVRRFLLLSEGKPCDRVRLMESERLLRAQPFIADASIRVFDDAHGGVVLVVQTVDELTPVLGVHASGRSPYVHYVKVGDGNVDGTARYMAAEWGSGDFRNIVGARVIDYQFLGHPWQLDILGHRGDLGESRWLVDIAHPFFTDQQRLAWRVHVGDDQTLFDYLRGDLPQAQVTIDRQFYSIGGIVRVGMPGRLSLFGLSFSREEDFSGTPPVLDSSVAYDSLLARFAHRQNARVNLLWGVRSLGFRRARNFDALASSQDLRVGFQLGTLLGRSLSVLGSTDDDILVASDLYVGAGSAQTFGYFTSVLEGRQDYDNNRWDGIIGSARFGLYQRLAERHTLVGIVDWAGGWHERIPLQLRLGQSQGGVRGFGDSHEAGAIRAVARLEERWYMGNIRDQAAVGISPFVDVGRVWAGDSPFGVNSPTAVGVGIGLLAAVPPQSRRTYRLDVGYAATHDPHARWELRVTILNADRRIEREPRDVHYTRELIVPSSVFNWP